jgi:YgiT-type zinc finger domain-containing protein
MKNCPLCGETMRLTTRDARSATPGPEGQISVRQIREWVCPECDYFEEAETGED